jgi:hypothetical protein
MMLTQKKHGGPLALVWILVLLAEAFPTLTLGLDFWGWG